MGPFRSRQPEGAALGPNMTTGVDCDESVALRHQGFADPGLKFAGVRGEATPSRRLQRLIEIADQIRGVLDADGEPHELRRDARGAAQRLGDRGVAHRPGMADQALDAAERLGEREVPDPLERRAPSPRDCP